MNGPQSVAGRLLWAAGIAGLAAGCGGAGGVTGPSTSVTLLDVQTQVFSPRCATTGCHIGANPPHGLDLSAGQSAGNLIGVPAAEVPPFLRVDPGNATDSYLYMKISGDPRINGDPMPAEGGPLSAGQVHLIETWIDQGAM